MFSFSKKNIVALFVVCFLGSSVFAGTYRCDFTGSPDGVRFGWKWKCEHSGRSESEVADACWRSLVRAGNLIVTLEGCQELSATHSSAATIANESTQWVNNSVGADFHRCGLELGMCERHCTKFNGGTSCYKGCYATYRACMSPKSQAALQEI